VQKEIEKSMKKKDVIEKLKDDIQKQVKCHVCVILTGVHVLVTDFREFLVLDDCDDQIRDREEHQKEAELEAQRDKERIDAIIAQVNAEDQAELEERLRRKVRTTDNQYLSARSCGPGGNGENGGCCIVVTGGNPKDAHGISDPTPSRC